MGDVAVFEAAQHMGDGVDFADMGEELVAEPFAARGAADQPGDIDEFQLGRDDLLRLGQLGQQIEPRIRHGYPAGIGFDRAEGIIGRRSRSRFGQRVEQRRFADIRQADNAAIEAHGLNSTFRV